MIESVYPAALQLAEQANLPKSVAYVYASMAAIAPPVTHPAPIYWLLAPILVIVGILRAKR